MKSAPREYPYPKKTGAGSGPMENFFQAQRTVNQHEPIPLWAWSEKFFAGMEKGCIFAHAFDEKRPVEKGLEESGGH